MDDEQAAQAEWWTALDREVQGISTGQQRYAQAVIDIAERTKSQAAWKGTNPLDDLLEIYVKLSNPRAQVMVRRSFAYLRAEKALERAQSDTELDLRVSSN